MERVKRHLSDIYHDVAIDTGTWKPRSEDDLAKLTPYKYRRLAPEEIRFVVLLKGEEREYISVEVEHENQGVKRGYAALSYVWGEHNANLKPILVESRRVHWITYNLWTALKRIRRSDVDLVLWVDAICINQASTTEKSQQLPNMRWIYPRAEKVLCWLGDDDGTVLEAFNALKAWAQAYEDPELRSKLVGNAEHYLASRRLGSQNGLSVLFNRPYWRRTWCLPEVCVDSTNPPILLAGKHELSWSELYKGFLCMGSSLDDCAALIGTNVGYLLPMIKTCWRPPEDLRMSELVPDAAIREAHDPHDILFSLLGLAERRGVEYPAPDYEKTIEETCILYTRAIITVDERLDILTTIAAANKDDSVPSWCIKPGRWSKSQITEIRRLDERRSGGSYRYSATRYLKPQVREPEYPQDPVLAVRGLSLDRIATTLELASFSTKDLKECKSWTDTIDVCRAFCSKHLSDGQYVMVYKDVVEAFLDTITCDDFWMFSRKLRQSEPRDRMYAAYQAQFQSQKAHEDVVCMEKDQLAAYLQKHFSFRGQEFESDIQVSTTTAGREPDQIHDFLEKRACNEFRRVVENKLAERTLLVTEQGYFGVGARQCNAGDIVCLLLGSSVPFVLRQVESHDADRYVLVGDAYVHGVMYGEGLEDPIQGANNPGLGISKVEKVFNIV